MKKRTAPRSARTSGRASSRSHTNETVAGERRRLFELIEERARNDKLPLTRLTREKLGIGFSYYAALKAGEGNIRNSMDFLERCAQYLQLPFVHVLIYAGIIGIEDFAQKLELKQYIDLAYFELSKDPHYASLLPNLEQWEISAMELKVFTVLVCKALDIRNLLAAGRLETRGISDVRAVELLLRCIVPDLGIEATPVRKRA